MRTVVIGGGVIGLSSAWALSQHSDVTVVDRGDFGTGASYGNAGWITTSLSAPMPAPGVVRQALKWMVRHDSPLLVRPRLDLGFLRWCWHFMRSCTDHAHAEGLAATLRLSEITNSAYDRMEADGISFRRHETGLLFLAQTDKGLREHEGMVGGLRAAGYSGRLTDVSPAELRSVEPAARPEIAGALHAEDDWHVQPYELCQSIAQWLANSGADLRARSSVAALTRDGAGWRVRLGDGQSLTCDRVLISAGAWSAQVARLAGLRLLLEPAKGYSITGTASTPPRHAIYMTEGKLGCSAFGGEVRLAGTLELAGLDDRVDPRRAGTLDRTAKRYLRDWTMTDAHTWTGFRPATPDGLPYIGQTAEPGLFIATGHGTLGVTLAAGTGLTLAQLMMGEPVAELEPFRPDRSPS